MGEPVLVDGEGNGAGEQRKIGGRKGEVWSLISDEEWWVVGSGEVSLAVNGRRIVDAEWGRHRGR